MALRLGIPCIQWLRTRQRLVHTSTRGILQYTLAILKPDVLQPEHIAKCRAVLHSMESSGIRVAAYDRPRWMSRDEAVGFYEEHATRWFFQKLVAFMTSGPIMPMVLVGENVVDAWKTLLGPVYRPVAWATAPESIRAQMAISDTSNIAHGSDSPITAHREIDYFFPDFDSTTRVEQLPTSLVIE